MATPKLLADGSAFGPPFQNQFQYRPSAARTVQYLQSERFDMFFVSSTSSFFRLVTRTSVPPLSASVKVDILSSWSHQHLSGYEIETIGDNLLNDSISGPLKRFCEST